MHVLSARQPFKCSRNNLALLCILPFHSKISFQSYALYDIYGNEHVIVDDSRLPKLAV